MTIHWVPRGDTWHPLWSILTNKLFLVSFIYYIFVILKSLYYQHNIEDIDWTGAASRPCCGHYRHIRVCCSAVA